MFYRLAMWSIQAGAGTSIDKIGACSSMGLDELTSYKWLSLGNGQIRT